MMGKPKIRFKGYNEDWEQRKLNEVAEFNPKSDLPESFEYVDLESVVGTEMVSHRTETKETAPSRAQRLAQTGDVFFQTVRPYQRNNYLFTKPDNNYVFSTGYAHMRPKIDAEFLMCFLQTDSFVKVVLDNCTGTSYPAINSNDLSNLEIDLPTSEDEQRRIGCFITNLDHLITLHHRKCVVLRKKKVNDWEQRKLGEVFEFQYGEFNNNPDNGGEYPIYGANGIIGGYTDWNAENSSIIGHMGAYAGYVVWGEGKHFVTYNGTIARPKDNSIDSKYGYYLLDSKKIYKICAGSGQPFVSYSDLNGIDILLPKDKDEQRLLAYYFTNLDHLITLHHRE